MNTYVPSNHTCSVHLSGPADTRSAPADSSTVCATRPARHADQSPRTELQRRPVYVGGSRAEVAALTAWVPRTLADPSSSASSTTARPGQEAP